MTNKEYKAKREMTETYSAHDYLTQREISELARDVKKRDGFQLKGFNNRATVKQDGYNLTLTSYYTDVASYNTMTKTFVKLWDGYSATTLKHINAFCDYLKIPGFNKREWIEL